MTITSQWVEPLNDDHHDKIIAAFNMHFIDEGGRPDGNGDGVGYGCGDGVLDGSAEECDDGRGDGYGLGWDYGFGDGDGGYALSGKCPEEWRVK